jgi:hypothetical protein
VLPPILLVLKRSIILMSRKFRVAHRTCMTATMVGPAVDGGIACTDRSKASATTSSATTALRTTVITALIAIGIATGLGWKLIIMLTGRVVRLIWWVLIMLLALLELCGGAWLILLRGRLLVGELCL